MDILFGKRFSKDLDAIQNESKTRKRLIELIKKMKEINSLSDLKGVKKIEGYSNYFRIRVGDYRLALKLSHNRVELIRFLHRKEIYKRFP